MKNGLDEQYIDLLKDILENGVEKETRNGKVLSVFGRTIRYKFKDGKFPLLTTKKMAFKTIVTELIWFLRGSTNIKYLVDNGCNIWNGDAYKYYLVKTKNQIEDPNDLNWDLSSPKDPKITQLTQEQFINKIKTDDEFAKKWGELGPVYGKQWRDWGGRKTDGFIEFESNGYNEHIKGIDQIANLINDIKTNPDSRRLMVNSWNVGELDSMVLPPCHYGFQVYTRELSDEEKWEQYSKSGLNIEINGIPLELKHMGTKFYPNSLPQRAISLMFNMRSNDVPLGLPFNIASYGLLLEIISRMVNMVPDELIANLGDAHIYLNQIDGVNEQIGRELSLGERRKMITQEMFNQIYNTGDSSTLSHSEINQWDIPRTETRQPYPLPTLKHMKTEEFYKSLSENVSLFGHLDSKDFQIENYQSHPSIKMPLSN